MRWPRESSNGSERLQPHESARIDDVVAPARRTPAFARPTDPNAPEHAGQAVMSITPTPPSLSSLSSLARGPALRAFSPELLTLYEPLAPRTWYQLGGPARVFARCLRADDLPPLARWAGECNLAVKVLGMGANILVRDEGFPGMVIHFDGELKSATLDGSTGLLHCGAGTDLMAQAKATARAGFAGLDVLAGIPASIGGALRMNAGGRWGDIGSVVQRVRCLHADGILRWHTAAECRFAYRHSAIPGEIIVEAELQLQPDDQAWNRYLDCLAYKARSQPAMGKNSAGCIFRNPQVNGAAVSAGLLIDQAGCKGWSEGGAEVSSQHGNFIVADPARGARAEHVLSLIERVREQVARVHGVSLKLEVDIW